jgi:hypothetical protein
MSETKPEQPDPPAPAPAYDAFWGQDAKVAHVRVAPRCMVTVPARFVRGPLLNIVQRKHGSATPDDVAAFCKDALLAWYEKYRERRTRASPERLAELRTLIPTPAETDEITRIEVNLEGTVKDDAFGRVLGLRFRANAEGRSLALREAILEALLVARGQPSA